ncbi:MAG TPA: hypothetical protein VEA78_01740, partial [Acidimicrobiales bacterium]|nr:hypothetical protein [Acidimicrobiales bacterium]
MADAPLAIRLKHPPREHVERIRSGSYIKILITDEDDQRDGASFETEARARQASEAKSFKVSAGSNEPYLTTVDGVEVAISTSRLEEITADGEVRVTCGRGRQVALLKHGENAWYVAIDVGGSALRAGAAPRAFFAAADAHEGAAVVVPNEAGRHLIPVQTSDGKRIIWFRLKVLAAFSETASEDGP